MISLLLYKVFIITGLFFLHFSYNILHRVRGTQTYKKGLNTQKSQKATVPLKFTGRRYIWPSSQCPGRTHAVSVALFLFLALLPGRERHARAARKTWHEGTL